MRKDSDRSRWQPAAQNDDAPLVVEGRWILRALTILVGVALVCGYLTFCWLFYQGQWQMVLHPVRTEARPALLGGRPYEMVRFGPDATGVPQRVGWWVPALPSTGYEHLVMLYLPSGDGSLADQTEVLDALSGTGAALFAINWRGYGASGAVRHPGEVSMREDAEAAWQYLAATRGWSASTVVPYGRGLGAPVMLWLVGQHPETPAMVLDAPRLDVAATVAGDPRVRLLPVGLLFKDRYELEPMLRDSRVPKLIVLRDAVAGRRVLEVGDPKITATLPRNDPGALDGLLRRFLGEYAVKRGAAPGAMGGSR